MALTEPAEKKTVSIEQFVSVRNLLDERERLAFDLAYFCGLRASEILGFRIGDLRRAPDGQQYLRIQRSFHKGAVNRPKTEASTRNVGIAPPVREQLVKWNANLPSTSPDSWVFPSMSITTPVWPENMLSDRIRPRLKVAGLAWVNFAVLRRSHSTEQERLDTAPRVVAKQQGHSMEVHYRSYVQTEIAELETAATKLYDRFDEVVRTSKTADQGRD